MERRIGVTEFKKRCLALIDGLGPEGIVITRRGRPAAKLIPLDGEPAALIGCLKGRIRIEGDLLSTGLHWDAGPRG